MPEVIDYQTGNAGGDGGHHGHAHDRGFVPGAAVKADGVAVYVHHDAAAAKDQRKGAEDDDEPVLALVVLLLVLQPELRELQLVPVLLRLVRLDAEIIVERDVQHAADRADGVNAGGLRRAGQAAADRPHGDVGFVGNLLVSHFPSLLIADLLDLQNPAPFLSDSAGKRLNAAENGGIMYC